MATVEYVLTSLVLSFIIILFYYGIRWLWYESRIQELERKQKDDERKESP